MITISKLHTAIATAMSAFIMSAQPNVTATAERDGDEVVITITSPDGIEGTVEVGDDNGPVDEEGLTPTQTPGTDEWVIRIPADYEGDLYLGGTTRNNDDFETDVVFTTSSSKRS